MWGGVTTTRRRQRRQLATGSSWAFGATNAANPMLFHSKRVTMGLGVRMASLWLAKKKGYRVRGAHRGLGTVYFYCCWCAAALCNLQPDGPCPTPVISRSLYIRHLWLSRFEKTTPPMFFSCFFACFCSLVFLVRFFCFLKLTKFVGWPRGGGEQKITLLLLP